jgi:hypothetical protein
MVDQVGYRSIEQLKLTNGGFPKLSWKFHCLDGFFCISYCIGDSYQNFGMLISGTLIVNCIDAIANN